MRYCVCVCVVWVCMCVCVMACDFYMRSWVVCVNHSLFLQTNSSITSLDIVKCSADAIRWICKALEVWEVQWVAWFSFDWKCCLIIHFILVLILLCCIRWLCVSPIIPSPACISSHHIGVTLLCCYLGRCCKCVNIKNVFVLSNGAWLYWYAHLCRHTHPSEAFALMVAITIVTHFPQGHCTIFLCVFGWEWVFDCLLRCVLVYVECMEAFCKVVMHVSPRLADNGAVFVHTFQYDIWIVHVVGFICMINELVTMYYISTAIAGMK